MACTLFPFIFSVTSAFSGTPSTLVSLPDVGPTSLLNQADVIGAIDPSTEINFTIWLKLNRKEELQQLIQDLYDPSSQKYQHFLAKKEFDSLYGPSSAAILAVQEYFTRVGLQAEVVDNHVDVKGTAQKINQTLHIKIKNYRYKNKIVYGTTVNPQMDPGVAQYIDNITGLDNVPIFSPTYIKIEDTTRIEKLANKHSDGTKKTLPKANAFSVLTGSAMRTAYNVNAVKPINGVTINGAGQTILIVLACSDYTPEAIQNDANIFSADNRLPLLTSSNFSVISNTGGPPPVTGGGCDPGWALETSLDVQAAHAMAPNANIILMLAQNAGGGIYTAINYAVQNFPGAVISNSWGANEGDTPRTVLDASLQQAAAQGQSIMFSTGDSGDARNEAGQPRVQIPAGNTYAIAVGGTTLLTGPNFKYLFEAAWGNYNVSSSEFVFFGGAGGGISKFYPALPAQTDAIHSFTAGGYGLVGDTHCSGTTCRALPDIGMDADPFTPIRLYNSTGCHGYCLCGGTSLSTPLFAGVLAMVNQARMLLAGNQQHPIGLITPYLYSQINRLKRSHALNTINPPHFFAPNSTMLPGYPSAFKNGSYSFNMDTSLTTPENQFWGDVAGVGSPNIPNFIDLFSTI